MVDHQKETKIYVFIIVRDNKTALLVKIVTYLTKNWTAQWGVIKIFQVDVCFFQASSIVYYLKLVSKWREKENSINKLIENDV